MRKILEFVQTIQQVIRRRRTVGKLSELSDRQLTDIGISRYEISKLVWGKNT